MAMTLDEAATAHAEAIARLRAVANAAYATPRDRADAIEAAKMAADEAATALTLARIAAKRRGPDSLEARVYRAAVAAFDRGETVYVRTMTRCTRIAPKHRDALRWSPSSGHVLIRRGRSWDAVIGYSLAALGESLGVPLDILTRQPYLGHVAGGTRHHGKAHASPRGLSGRMPTRHRRDHKLRDLREASRSSESVS